MENILLEKVFNLLMIFGMLPILYVKLIQNRFFLLLYWKEKALYMVNLQGFVWFCFRFWRKDGDSNPGDPLEVYTLSRRARSATPASFHCSGAKIEIILISQSTYFIFSWFRQIWNITPLKMVIHGDRLLIMHAEKKKAAILFQEYHSFFLWKD